MDDKLYNSSILWSMRMYRAYTWLFSVIWMQNILVQTIEFVKDKKYFPVFTVHKILAEPYCFRIPISMTKFQF